MSEENGNTSGQNDGYDTAEGDPPELQLLEQQIPPPLPLPGSELDPNMSEENGYTNEQNDEYDAGKALLLFALEV